MTDEGLSGDGIVQLVQDEGIRAIIKETERIVVRDFLKRVGELVREGSVPTSVRDRLSELLRSRREDIIVALEDYPGLLALGKADVLPIEKEIGGGLVVVKRDATPYLGIFRSYPEHSHIVTLFTSLNDLLFAGSRTFSVRNVLNDRQNRFSKDFWELCQSRLEQLEVRLGDRLRRLCAMRYGIAEYDPQVANLLREYAQAANKAVDTLLEGVRRLEAPDESDRQAVSRCVAALLGTVGVLHHYLMVFNRNEAHNAEHLSHTLLTAFKTHGQEL